jgi:4'-phosphopantetheinyl transferase
VSSLQASPDCAIDPAEVHLWCWRTREQPGDIETLSPDECERAARFRFPRDRAKFIAARAGLRRILSGYVGRDATTLRFEYGRSAKPALPGGPPFNLSHSGEIAVLGVAGFEIGVDVEHVRLIKEDIAGRFFAREEIAALVAVPEERRAEAFLACWTRKEAYVKAVGDGLLMPLDEFAVSVAHDQPARMLRIGSGGTAHRQWQLFHFEPAAGYIGAIAARRRGWRVVLRSTVDWLSSEAATA